MADEFCLKMPDFHVTFRDLLHVVNLRHGTKDFTSLPKEGMLRIFFASKKIHRLRSVLNPRIWVPKASTLLLDHRSRSLNSGVNKEIKFKEIKFLRFGLVLCGSIRGQMAAYVNKIVDYRVL